MICRWSELSDEEKVSWMKAMTIADQRHEYYKYHEKRQTLKENLLENENKRRRL